MISKAYFYSKTYSYFMLLLNLLYLGINKEHKTYPCTQADSIILLETLWAGFQYALLLVLFL